MKLNTYKISGQIKKIIDGGFNEIDGVKYPNNDSYETVDIDAEVKDSSAISAFENFMANNSQYVFFGCCTDTTGTEYALFEYGQDMVSIEISK